LMLAYDYIYLMGNPVVKCQEKGFDSALPDFK
jgi:hypothetical protein